MAEAFLEIVPARVTACTPDDVPAGVGLSLCWSDPEGRPHALLLEGVVNVGAHHSNELILEDRFVSGFHCRVQLSGARVRVKDLGSTNGTAVDGLRVAEAELSAGARLRVGRHELRLERQVKARGPQLPGLLAKDPALWPVLSLLARAAPSRLPVMLLGESGSGKEVAARAVHELSLCSAGPFVPVNCGAISHELAEAELFGHEKGAFTGAVTSAPGAFGAADGGTLFLDEIGDLPLPLQVKLLRALEAGEVKPVGAARPRQIEVRVVCATHQDLRRRVREGTFREDLFYRLRGLTVELPPLRARPGDILPLAEHFLSACPGPHRQLAADARAALVGHRWPGNVRELRHVIQLAALLSDGPVIRASALQLEEPAPLRCAEAVQGFGAGGPPDEPPEPSGVRGRTLRELEEHAIRSAHARLGGNRRAVSRELGIAKSSLLRKLDQLGLRP